MGCLIFNRNISHFDIVVIGFLEFFLDIYKYVGSNMNMTISCLIAIV